jgi:hypothetical protein
MRFVGYFRRQIKTTKNAREMTGKRKLLKGFRVRCCVSRAKSIKMSLPTA